MVSLVRIISNSNIDKPDVIICRNNFSKRSSEQQDPGDLLQSHFFTHLVGGSSDPRHHLCLPTLCLSHPPTLPSPQCFTENAKSSSILRWESSKKHLISKFFKRGGTQLRSYSSLSRATAEQEYLFPSYLSCTTRTPRVRSIHSPIPRSSS